MSKKNLNKTELEVAKSLKGMVDIPNIVAWALEHRDDELYDNWCAFVGGWGRVGERKYLSPIWKANDTKEEIMKKIDYIFKAILNVPEDVRTMWLIDAVCIGIVIKHGAEIGQ